MYLQSSTDNKNLKTIQDAEKSRNCTDNINMILISATEERLYKYMRSGNISQNVPVKGLSTGERTQDPSFQGKIRMDDGVIFLQEMMLSER